MTASIDATTWGRWPAMRLQDARIAATVVPAVGGRIVSLLDRRSGREWLTQGEPPDPVTLDRWGREEAVFGGRESFGWDECLPSVSVCPDPLDRDGAPLRDHGDQWGRASEMTADVSRGLLTSRWPSPRWPMVLERALSLPGDATLRADYRLVSNAERTLPVLWSAHPVLDAEPGARVELRTVTAARVTGVLGWPFATGDEVPWPEPAPGFDLSRVRPVTEHGAAKLYAATTTAAVSAPDGARLAFDADEDLVRTMGVWLDAGGWPVGGRPVAQTALEPTSSGHDHLEAAMADRAAWALPAGGTLRWSIRVRLEEAT